MRVGFVTCVQLGFACIEEIYRLGGKLDFVVTLDDEFARKKSGRVFLDEFCARECVDLTKVKSINDPASLDFLRCAEVDWLFIIGWSQMAQQAVLDAPTYGAIGAHPTLLPEGRGRAAIPWTILKGLTRTGVTFFKMDSGIDTGPIIEQELISVDPGETATTLYQKVSDAHRTLIGRVWADLQAGKLVLRQQEDSQATTWPGRRPEDGEVLPMMTVADTERLVRAATHPYPGAFIRREGQIIRIWGGRVGLPGQSPPDSALRVQLFDGVYDATEYEIEERNEN